MGSITPCQSGPESNTNEAVPYKILKALKLEPHTQMQFSVKPRTLILFDSMEGP